MCVYVLVSLVSACVGVCVCVVGLFMCVFVDMSLCRGICLCVCVLCVFVYVHL